MHFNAPPSLPRSIAVLLLFAYQVSAFSWAHQTAHGDEPRWFKGNLHTHSLWSDGNNYPEMIVDWYRENGYHFLALSDHNVLSEGIRWIDAREAGKRGAVDALERYQERFGEDWVETREENGNLLVRLKPLNEFRSLFEKSGEFILLQGEEITDGFQNKPIHINASNLRDLIRPQGGESVRDTIARNLDAVTRQRQRIGRPILAHLNHPNFGYGVSAEDLAAVVQERFFEVYNGHPGVAHLGDDDHPSIERLWDIANTLRLQLLQAPPLYGLGTDDSHNYFGRHGSSPGRGWVMVRAKWLTPEALIHAIEAGDFYASSGVTLADVRFDAESRTLSVEVEPEKGAVYSIAFIGTRRQLALPEDVLQTTAEGESSPSYRDGIGETFHTTTGTRAEYALTGDELYVRAVVTSDQPHPNPSFDGQTEQAWTQPQGWREYLASDSPRDE